MYKQTEKPTKHKNAMIVGRQAKVIARHKNSGVLRHLSTAQFILIKAQVTALTHLVKAKGNSIFEGEEAGEVSHGMSIEIENSDKIRSRRGPNQEMNRAYDLDGQPIYRWVLVTKVNNKAIAKNTYIRDDAFATEVQQPLGSKSSVISDDHRLRSGAMANQNIFLVGTTHNMEVHNNKSGSIGQELEGADLIVEHPTPMARQKTKIDTSVMDGTQISLIEKASKMGAKIIGGDGRKLITADARVHALSVRSQPQSLTLDPQVTGATIDTLCDSFVTNTLGINSDNIEEMINAINALGAYSTKRSTHQLPDVVSVFKNVFRRVNSITKYFKPQVKMALKNKVLAVFRQDVRTAAADTQSELDGFREYYDKKGQLDQSEQQIYDNGVRDYTKAINDASVTPFHDAISNLTLFSEVLASNKQNLVVAYGAEHVRPLAELLNTVNTVHKNYKVVNKT